VSSPSDISFLEIVRQDWNYNDTTLAAICIKEMMAAEYPPLTRGASQTWTLQLACLTSSTADPRTGLPWAVGMKEELEHAVLALRQGDGHASFLLGGDMSKIIGKYLITGKAPRPGLITTS
jgi:hypothetical protein